MKKVILSSFVLIIGAIILAYSMPISLYNELNNLKLIPESEAFTELYFDTYPQAQAQISDGTHVSFTFTVHNLEGTTTAYAYQVYFVSGNATTTIQNGTTTLANTASTTIAESLTLKSSFQPGDVFVSLPALGQHIDFYIPQD
jgi:hypothetical protein